MNLIKFFLTTIAMTIVFFYSEAKMDQSPKNSFERSEKSPTPSASDEAVLKFNMPNSVDWGGVINIYGYMKNPPHIISTPSLNVFSLQIKDPNSGEFINGSENYHIGDPPIHSEKEPYEIIKEKREIYFNGPISNKYSVLAPGTYNVSISYHKLESQAQKLIVENKGWRREFSDFMVNLICKEDVLIDFEKYLDWEHDMSLVDIAEGSSLPSPEEFIESIDLHKVFKKKYMPLIKSQWQEGLKKKPNLDYTIANDVENHVKTMCSKKPKRKEDVLRMVLQFSNLVIKE